MTIDENIVFGINSVREKLRASTKDVLEILVADSSDRSALRQIREDAERCGLQVTRVQARTLDHLVGGQRHQGVIARLQAYRYTEFAELIEQLSDSALASRILILDGQTREISGRCYGRRKRSVSNMWSFQRIVLST
jgi:23S rRNA (guanosine2251-2'-O)-methyltransferase